MNKYIIELLKIQSSVILPGFGSLVITSKKTGKITFNALLKFNDGVLAKYISEKEGIDQQNAQNQIAKFVREIEAELGKGNSFDIFELGKFQKNDKGEVMFVQDEKSVSVLQAESTVAPKVEKKVEKPAIEKIKEEAKKSEPVQEIKSKIETNLTDKLKEAEEKKELPKKAESEKVEEKPKNSFNPTETKKSTEAEQKTEISKNIPVANATKKETPAQDKNVFKPTEVKQKADDKKVPVSTGEYNKDEKTDKVQNSTSQQSIKEKFKKDKPQKIKHKDPESGKKPKKKKRTVLWIIIILILGGGATAGYFYKDEINNFLHQGVGEHDSDSTHTNVAHNDTTHQDNHADENLHEEDTTMAENIDVVVDETIEEPVKEKPIEKPVKEKPVVNHNTGSSGSYHIIGNAFSSETNAENYVAKMKEKGYPAQNIGKYNGLYLVSLKSFSSKDEAKSNLSSVKADADGAYVFTKK